MSAGKLVKLDATPVDDGGEFEVVAGQDADIARPVPADKRAGRRLYKRHEVHDWFTRRSGDDDAQRAREAIRKAMS